MNNNQEKAPQNSSNSEIKIADLSARLAEQEKMISAQREEINQLYERIRSDQSAHLTQIHALENDIYLLREKATLDDLTQLYRRNSFEIELDKEISRINLSQSDEHREHRKGNILKDLSVIFIDADHFKQINDTRGHKEGDNVLKQIAHILKNSVRKSDFVCRWGGEEMVIGLPGADESTAYETAEKIRKKIQDNTGHTVSMGIASYESSMSRATLIERADLAMYKAKHKPGGRNCVERYSHFTPEDHKQYKSFSR